MSDKANFARLLVGVDTIYPRAYSRDLFWNGKTKFIGSTKVEVRLGSM